MSEILERALTPDTPIIKHLSPEVRGLWQRAEGLMNGSEARNAELRNIQSIILAMVENLSAGSFSDADNTLDSVQKRLDALEKDPENAGKHEFMAAAETWSSFMTSIALRGNKTKLLDFIMDKEVRAAKLRLEVQIGKEKASQVMDAWYIENGVLFI